MGLLKLLTFPVSGPIGGTVWIAEQLRAEAERELYESAIHRDLIVLQQRYESGELSQAEYEEAADLLVDQLLAADELDEAGGPGTAHTDEERNHG